MTVQYENDRPKRVDAIVISTQHTPDVAYETIRDAMIDHIIKKVIPANLIDADTKIFINPTGRFVIGGPSGDTGLTGRKIIVDTYGGMGGMAAARFPGKTRPRWTGRRHIWALHRENVVAAGLAHRCEVRLLTLSALPSRYR